MSRACCVMLGSWTLIDDNDDIYLFQGRRVGNVLETISRKTINVLLEDEETLADPSMEDGNVRSSVIIFNNNNIQSIVNMDPRCKP